MEQVKKDNFVGIAGLTTRIRGKNPAVVILDANENIVGVINNNYNSKNQYQVGLNLEDYEE
jgi:hypothetical protein